MRFARDVDAVVLLEFEEVRGEARRALVRRSDGCGSSGALRTRDVFGIDALGSDGTDVDDDDDDTFTDEDAFTDDDTFDDDTWLSLSSTLLLSLILSLRLF